MRGGRRNTEVVAESLRTLLRTVHCSQNALVEAAAQVAEPAAARLLASIATSRVSLERELRELLARVEGPPCRLAHPAGPLQELNNRLSAAVRAQSSREVLERAAELEDYVAQEYQRTTQHLVGVVADVLQHHGAVLRSHAERLRARSHVGAADRASRGILRSLFGGDSVVDRDAE